MGFAQAQIGKGSVHMVSVILIRIESSIAPHVRGFVIIDELLPELACKISNGFRLIPIHAGSVLISNKCCATVHLTRLLFTTLGLHAGVSLFLLMFVPFTAGPVGDTGIVVPI